MARFGKYLSLSIIFVLTILLIIQPVNAQTENVTTSCYIIVNNIVEGQPVKAEIHVSPAPPEAEVFNNITVNVISPLQGIWGNGNNGPWGKNNIVSDSNGIANVTFEIDTFSGYWNIEVYFLGQSFANNTLYYQKSYYQTGFTISPAKTPTPTITPSPTPLSTSSPSPSPTIPEFPITATLIAVLAAVSLLLMIGKKRLSIKMIDRKVLQVIAEWVAAMMSFAV